MLYAVKKEQKLEKARCLQPVPVEGDSKDKFPLPFFKESLGRQEWGVCQKMLLPSTEKNVVGWRKIIKWG